MLRIVIGSSPSQFDIVKPKVQTWVSALLHDAVLNFHSPATSDILDHVVMSEMFSGWLFLFYNGMDESRQSISDLSVKLRSFLHNTYFIYFNDDLTFLRELVSLSVMPFGFHSTRSSDSDVLQSVLNAYQKYIRSKNRQMPMLSVTSGGTLHNIPYQKINYIESADKLIHIITDTGSVSFRDTLSHLEVRLKSDFLRCHHSFLVNVSKIRSIDSKEIITTGGKSIPISRNYQAQIKTYMNQQRTM